jgi:hypothetical protein
MPIQPLRQSHDRKPVDTSVAAFDAAPPAGFPDFERLVGREGWWRLAPDIRRRFSEHPHEDRPIHYVGVMHRVDASPWGWVLAQLCRLIGTPFAPHCAADVPVTITLRQSPGGRIVWERDYRYPNRPAIRVRSTKCVDADGSLLECVGFGLGMRLAVFEADHALHFLSLHYFCHLGRRRLRLPNLLSPGTAHVVHEDLGQGRFRFTMTIHHRLFGTLFRQDGVFHRQGVEP